MLSKIIILFLIVSCGPEVRLKENKLENITPLTDAELLPYQKEGTLVKGQTPTVLYQSKTYEVSKYSSKQSQDFINSLSGGVSVPIIFTGGIKGTEVVLESVERR